jgi:histidinol-phosphate aminotransferase
MNALPRARPEAFTVPPYIGGESKLPGVNRVIKLSSNEGAFGPPPGAVAAMVEHAARAHRYPEDGMAAARAALGAAFGLDPARIICGNGSDEVLALLIHAYGGPGTELIMSAHGFSIYEIAGSLAGCRVVKARERNLTTDVDAILALVTDATRLVCLANPNNPTGTLLGQNEMRRLRRGLPPDVLLVIDAAYAEYVERDDYDAGVQLVDEGENTAMTRTFSKIFGLGGARFGWCYAAPSIIDVLNRMRPPFNVSSLAGAAAVAALAEPGWVDRGRAHNTRERNEMAARLRAAGFVVHPCEANFLLVDFLFSERAAAADAHLRRRGIIVRHVKSYGLPSCLRITIGTSEDCAAVTKALEAFDG